MQRRRGRGITLHLQRHKFTSPKAASCQSIHSDNHTAFHQIQKLVLTPIQWRTSEVQVVPRPSTASCKQEPALAIQRQHTAYVFIHLYRWRSVRLTLIKLIRLHIYHSSSAAIRFSHRKEIVNSLAFVLDKCFGLQFASARNSRPLLISLRLYWWAT